MGRRPKPRGEWSRRLIQLNQPPARNWVWVRCARCWRVTHPGVLNNNARLVINRVKLEHLMHPNSQRQPSRHLRRLCQIWPTPQLDFVSNSRSHCAWLPGPNSRGSESLGRISQGSPATYRLTGCRCSMARPLARTTGNGSSRSLRRSRPQGSLGTRLAKTKRMQERQVVIISEPREWRQNEIHFCQSQKPQPRSQIRDHVAEQLVTSLRPVSGLK